MVLPYITEKDGVVSCLCKGCGTVLWSRGRRPDGTEVSEVHPVYGDLYLAMVNEAGVLSKHSTPCCPDCAARLLETESLVELDEWWGADVFHWFIEERVRGQSPDAAYETATRQAGGRHPVRVLRYDGR